MAVCRSDWIWPSATSANAMVRSCSSSSLPTDPSPIDERRVPRGSLPTMIKLLSSDYAEENEWPVNGSGHRYRRAVRRARGPAAAGTPADASDRRAPNSASRCGRRGSGRPIDGTPRRGAGVRSRRAAVAGRRAARGLARLRDPPALQRLSRPPPRQPRLASGDAGLGASRLALTTLAAAASCPPGILRANDARAAARLSSLIGLDGVVAFGGRDVLADQASRSRRSICGRAR